VLFDLSSATVFPEFVQGLSAMPNLETIQLLYVERHARKHKSLDPPTRLVNEFRGRLFASVRTLVIPMAALELVACCPQIEHLTIDDTVPYAIRPDVVPKIAAQAKQLRVFRCRSIPGHCLKGSHSLPFICMCSSKILQILCKACLFWRKCRLFTHTNCAPSVNVSFDEIVE
jgi:hypothetical protein